MTELPKPMLWRDALGLRGYTADPGEGPWFTADQLLAYRAEGVAEAMERAAREADYWQALSDRGGYINKSGTYIAAAIRALAKEGT